VLDRLALDGPVSKKAPPEVGGLAAAKSCIPSNVAMSAALSEGKWVSATITERLETPRFAPVEPAGRYDGGQPINPGGRRAVPTPATEMQKAWTTFLMEAELANNYKMANVLTGIGGLSAPNPVLDLLLPSLLYVRLGSLIDEALAESSTPRASCSRSPTGRTSTAARASSPIRGG
jgi:hypothetical protein